MAGFSFSTSKTIISKLGGSSLAGSLLKSLGCRNVLLVTDQGVQEAGLLEAATAGLDKAGVAYTVFDGVTADPPAAVVEAASAAAAEAGADGVLGVGGGSPMDVAKLVAFLNGDTEQRLDSGALWGVEQCVGTRLPLVQVPTTAGTGSEVTPISIVTTGASEKKGVVSSQLYPDYAIADGDLTLSVPRAVTAYTGIDAMVHCVEALTSKHKKNPLSDLLALEGLRLLGSNIRRVCEVPDDREARGAMLLGSMYGGMAFANAPVAAVHALAYPIGALYKVPHGLSNSLVLPHVLRFNGEDSAAAAIYEGAAKAAFPHSRTASGGAEVLAAGFEALASDLGIETTLREVGIGADNLDTLAEQALLQVRLLPNNPREVLLEDAKALYAAALE